MALVGFPVGVNKRILDNAQITVGENAVKEDSLETGKKRYRLAQSMAPKQYQVTMDFSWLPDERTAIDGLTEIQRFWAWYEQVLKYKVNEFEFPSILLGEGTGKTEWYRIVSAVSGGKSGYCVRVNMTWESVFQGVVSVSTAEPALTDVFAKNGYVDFIISPPFVTEPFDTDFSIKIKNAADSLPITKRTYDGNETTRAFFDKITAPGSYIFICKYKSQIKETALEVV